MKAPKLKSMWKAIYSLVVDFPFDSLTKPYVKQWGRKMHLKTDFEEFYNPKSKSYICSLYFCNDGVEVDDILEIKKGGVEKGYRPTKTEVLQGIKNKLRSYNKA